MKCRNEVLLRSSMALLIAAAMAACASGEKALQDRGLKPMSAEQVKAMFATPRTMVWQGGGNAGTSEFLPDGTVKVSVGPNFSDAGRYRVTDGGWCSQYGRVRGGAETCFRVYQTGPNAYSTVTDKGDGDVTFSFR